MKRLIIAASVVALGVVAAFAQNDPIATRKADMKKVGAASAEMAKITKGEAPFDLAKVQDALKTMSEVAKVMPALFPETSKTGGETAALPKVWETKADFDARFVKFAKDAADAASTIKDEATFKAAFPEVGKNCGGCHESYRAKRS